VQVSLCHFMPYLTDPTVAEAARRGVELCSANLLWVLRIYIFLSLL
jgi:hypothetical protein